MEASRKRRRTLPAVLAAAGFLFLPLKLNVLLAFGIAPVLPLIAHPGYRLLIAGLLFEFTTILRFPMLPVPIGELLTMAGFVFAFLLVAVFTALASEARSSPYFSSVPRCRCCSSSHVEDDLGAPAIDIADGLELVPGHGLELGAKGMTVRVVRLPASRNRAPDGVEADVHPALRGEAVEEFGEEVAELLGRLVAGDRELVRRGCGRVARLREDGEHRAGAVGEELLEGGGAGDDGQVARMVDELPRHGRDCSIKRGGTQPREDVIRCSGGSTGIGRGAAGRVRMYVKAIGDAAGAVWKLLGSKGRVALTTLPKLLDQDGALVQQGVGWLAREHKVEFEKDGRALYVKLTSHEADVYKHHPSK